MVRHPQPQPLPPQLLRLATSTGSSVPPHCDQFGSLLRATLPVTPDGTRAGRCVLTQPWDATFHRTMPGELIVLPNVGKFSVLGGWLTAQSTRVRRLSQITLPAADLRRSLVECLVRGRYCCKTIFGPGFVGIAANVKNATSIKSIAYRIA